jgi:hypothetical protein
MYQILRIENDNKIKMDLLMALTRTTPVITKTAQKEAKGVNRQVLYSGKSGKLTRDGELHHHTTRPPQSGNETRCDLQQTYRTLPGKGEVSRKSGRF